MRQRKCNKCNKFRPFKIPRYLPGEVADNVMKSDLKMFNQHRYRVFTAKAQTDHYPLKMNPFNYFNMKKLREDALRLRKIDAENKSLLKKINIINRTGGKVDTYNPIAYQRVNKWEAVNKDLKRLENHNKKIFCNITNATSFYQHTLLHEIWKSNLIRIKHCSKYPLTVLEKSSVDKEVRAQLSISYLLKDYTSRPDIRPYCFIDFKLRKNNKFLGKLIIELYQDFVPVTVQNFLELCKSDLKLCKSDQTLTYKGNLVHRIVKGSFLEMGDITHNNGKGGFSVYGESFPEESHGLKHTRPGVLSMKRIGWAENNSQFCITFRRIDSLDNMNVVFGQVVVGNEVLLNTIQNYGRKIGKPLEEIVVADCGEYFPKNRCGNQVANECIKYKLVKCKNPPPKHYFKNCKWP